jgi:hypothetical protein
VTNKKIKALQDSVVAKNNSYDNKIKELERDLQTLREHPDATFNPFSTTTKNLV